MENKSVLITTQKKSYQFSLKEKKRIEAGTWTFGMKFLKK
jgi:hypothetical protein